MKNGFVITFSLVLLCAYHVYSIGSGGEYHLWPNLRMAELSFSFFKKKATIRVPAEVERKFASSTDFTSTKVRELSFIARYLLHDYPSFMFSRTSEGRDRFYWRNEVCFSYESSIPAIENAVAISHRFLEQEVFKGTDSLVLIPPTKISIERRHIGKLPNCDLWEISTWGREVYSSHHEIFERKFDSRFINLHRSFLDYLDRRGGEELFSPIDVHWTSLGIALATKAILEKLVQKEFIKGDFSVIHQGFIRNDWMWGDFLSYLQLPPWYVRSHANLHWQEPLYRIQAKGFSIVAKKNFQLKLFGTSYTARLRDLNFSIADLLRDVLGGARVHDYSFPRAGAWGSFRKFFSCGGTIGRGDIIIWEFPLNEPPHENWNLDLLKSDFAKMAGTPDGKCD